MNKKVLARIVLITGFSAVIGIPQLASAASVGVPCAAGPSPTNVTSCSTALYVDLTILGGMEVALGPVADAFGTAPASYSVSTTPVSLFAPLSLGLLELGVTATAISDSASSTYTGSVATLASTATSSVADLDLELAIPAVIVGGITTTQPVSLLGITSTTLDSTSSASKIDGGTVLLTSGSSEIEGLAISVLGVAVAVPVGSTANDSLVNALGLQIISNYQTPIYDGPFLDGIETAALAIKFDNYGFVGGVLNGTILIADSAASVPEPGTWAMALVGLGLVGAATRRQRTLALA